VVNQLSHRIVRAGNNTTSMGRWSWVQLRGREQFTLRIVTFYRPCYSTGPSTTYQQQIRRLAALDRDINPRKAVTQDLHTVIQEWQNAGDQVILLTDFNDDVTSTPAKPWAASMGLVEALSYLHPRSPPPPTFQFGSHPIDGIFFSPELLTNAQGGYLGFGEAVNSDHRALWLDLDLPQLCPLAREAYL